MIEPIFERDFAPQSYGFRPGRGCKDALRRVDELLKEGRVWVVDADIKGYFDTIPQDALMERVGRKIADGRIIGLIEGYLSEEDVRGRLRSILRNGTEAKAVGGDETTSVGQIPTSTRRGCTP